MYGVVAVFEGVAVSLVLVVVVSRWVIRWMKPSLHLVFLKKHSEVLIR